MIVKYYIHAIWNYFPYKKVEPQNIGFCDYIRIPYFPINDYAWLKDYLNIYLIVKL